MTAHEYRYGDVVRKSDRVDAMAYYMFREWADCPAHSTGGRVAILQWMYNGTDAGAWERELRPADVADAAVIGDIIAAERARNKHG